MIAAKKLLDDGYNVTIYEKESRAGGIAKTINICGFDIEKHYRHIFKCDKYVIELIKELKLEKELKWPKVKMGYYIDNKKYRFGQPLTLLTFKPFTFVEKLKFGIGVLKIKAIKDYKSLENITAEKWIIDN